ncbi:ABC transporter ATP-binding protein [Streptosporangium sp. NPDC002607]
MTDTVVVDDLTIRYGDAVAVDGVSFRVAQGECLAVLGSNGAGKSTVAKALAGLLKPASGSIEVAGHPHTESTPYRLARNGVVYLPEGRGIFPTLTVAENIKLGVRTLPRGQRRAAEARAYEYFPILGERVKQVAQTLSGGEQQMLALARALVTNPRLIVIDELSLGLAPLVIEAVYTALAKTRTTGVSIVLIEQYVDKALGFADRVLIMRRGSVVWEGPVDAGMAAVAQSYLGGEVAEEV